MANGHKHADTNDLVQAEDGLKSQGRTIESNLVHGLITHQNDIKDTHAERNFWGQNHGGIDTTRLQNWSNRTSPGFTAFGDNGQQSN
jgi:hypothetical protein